VSVRCQALGLKGRLRASFVSIIVADPSTLPAPGGRHPAPTRAAVETCADPEWDGRESEAVPEEETIAEAEARSKAGASHEAGAEACTTETTADKPASEPSTAESTTEATAPKTTSVEPASVKTTPTEATGIASVGSHHGTGERDGS
jgi:hypothetical protein